MRKIMVLLIVSLFSLGCVVNEGQLIVLEPTAVLPVITEQVADTFISTPFETIERSDGNGANLYQMTEPQLIVISNEQDIEAVQKYISDEAIQTLGELDFNTHLIFLVFHGWLPYLDTDVFQVTSVSGQANQLSFFATTSEPARATGQRAMKSEESSPYHLIKIPYRYVEDTALTAKLYFDQQPVLSVIHDFD